jgi:hypothetical protein
LAEIAAEMREPFVSVFEPEAAEQLICRSGFEEIVQFAPTRRLRATSPTVMTSACTVPSD